MLEPKLEKYRLDTQRWDEAVRRILSGRWPPSKRPRVHGFSTCLGLLKGLDGGPMINDGEYLSPGATRSINETLVHTLYKLKTKFTWSSLQINLDTVADWHQDSDNIGNSAILVGGDFSGGEFVLQDFAPSDMRGHVAFFNGRLWHRSLPFSGHRVSVVAFTHGLFDANCRRVVQSLTGLGFKTPAVLHCPRT